jgi:endonuclease-3
MRKEDIHAVLRILRREIKKWSEPVVGLVASQSSNPFMVLIACVLSLRTKDQTTNEACQRLFPLAPDAASMKTLSLKQLEQLIYPVGFYRTKARQIRQICDKLLKDYGGEVPDSIDELLTLNGVGRKTANLVVTVGYQKPGICVDVHVHRICNRWGYVKTRKPEETEVVLRNQLPKQYWITFNDLLVPFGQNLCRPISPFCKQCKLSPFCRRIGVTSTR